MNEEEEIPQLQDWDKNRPVVQKRVTYQSKIVFVPNNPLEVTFLFFSLILFGTWFGLTTETFKNLVTFSCISAPICCVLIMLSFYSKEGLLKQNFLYLFFAIICFISISFLFFYIRVHFTYY